MIGRSSDAVSGSRRLVALFLLVAIMQPVPAQAQLGIAIVDGFSSVRNILSGFLNHLTRSEREIARAEAEQSLLVDTDLLVKEEIIKNGPDVINPMCELYTARAGTTQALEWYGKGMRASMEEGLNYLTMNTASPTRLAVGWVYRLCKSGQLRRGTPAANFTDSDFGWKWFDDNHCIEDQTQAHAFLRPSTILEHAVLVPPSREQMEVLNNPATYDPADGGAGHPIAGTPATVWAALTDKQKLFVGAKLFCENLAMGWVAPSQMNSSASSTPDNAPVIHVGLGKNGRQNLALDVCRNELTRRVAPNPTLPEYAGVAPMAHLEEVRDKIGTYFVEIAGKNPVEVLAYTTNPGTGTIIPGATNGRYYISQYLVERFAHDYCGNARTAVAFLEKSGSAADNSGIILDCLEVAENWELKEAMNRIAFVQAVAGMDTAPTPAAKPAPIKTHYDGNGPLPETPLRIDATLRRAMYDENVTLGALLRQGAPASALAENAIAGSGGAP